jgi:Xaa-Pro dipeptidase
VPESTATGQSGTILMTGIEPKPFSEGGNQMKRELPFSMEEYRSRLDKVKANMQERRLDVLLLLSSVSINYLTGSLNKSGQYLVVPLKGEPIILAYKFELPWVFFTSWLNDGVGYETGENQAQAARKMLDRQGLLGGCIGIETDSHHISAQVIESLRNALQGAKIVDGSGIILKLLRMKSPREIECIKEAGKFTAQAMAAAVDAVRAGARDSEVAAAAHQAAIADGGGAMCLQPVVTAGFRSGLPHSHHLNYAINPGEPVCIELSGVYERYNCPLMRTVFVGKQSDGVLKMADACMDALEAILGIFKPSVNSEEVAAKVSQKLPLDDPEIVFHNTYGYSIGLGFPPGWSDDEWLRIIKGRPFTLQPGMVFHSTMSLRRNGKYGIFISEVIAITKDGCEVLGNFPRQYYYK